jgi:hypothetical protein
VSLPADWQPPSEEDKPCRAPFEGLSWDGERRQSTVLAYCTLQAGHDGAHFGGLLDSGQPVAWPA